MFLSAKWLLCKRHLADNSSVFGTFDHVEGARECANDAKCLMFGHVFAGLEGVHALGDQGQDGRLIHSFGADGFDDCEFRRIRPLIPTTSARLYRGIRPSLTRCREAFGFGYQFSVVSSPV